MTLVRIRGTSGFIRVSTRPERPIAALTTRAEPTMMTMSSLKPRKASFGFDDAAGHRGEQRQQGDQIVANAIPDQQADGAEDDGEGERLIERHAASAGLLAMTGRLQAPQITRRPAEATSRSNLLHAQLGASEAGPV